MCTSLCSWLGEPQGTQALASGSFHSSVESRSDAIKQINKNKKFTFFFLSSYKEDQKGE